MVVSGCSRCRGVVALHEGRPSVTSTGAVELWHRDCFAEGPLVEPPRSPDPVMLDAQPSRRHRWAIDLRKRFAIAAPPTFMGIAIAIAIGVSALVGLGTARVTLRSTPTPALANLDLGSSEPERAVTSVRETKPPRPVHIETALEVRYPMPTLDSEDLDSAYPSLRGWIHPVTSSAELMPELPSRHFGASREGVERPECGAGHCGIDLDAPRGRPLVAVADGIVVRVERAELGADGRSGRYVRIQHDDGTLTAYMHMDDVAEDLDVGNHVLAGQYIGTLGATAVGHTPPHCHFSLELPNSSAAKGDVRDTHYIDPAPFLVRSTIVKTPDRRHAVKPAF